MQQLHLHYTEFILQRIYSKGSMNELLENHGNMFSQKMTRTLGKRKIGKDPWKNCFIQEQSSMLRLRNTETTIQGLMLRKEDWEI